MNNEISQELKWRERIAMSDNLSSGNALRKINDIFCKMCAYQSVELEKLQKENSLLRECVDFYANEFNWTTFREDHLCRLDYVIKDDKNTYSEVNDENERILVCIGGKKARQCLAKLEENDT